MNRNAASTKSNALPRSKQFPVRGTPVKQSGLLRRYSSSSDLSLCSDSSCEDIYLSANDDETWAPPGGDRKNSNSSNRSLSPAPRMRSKSAGPIRHPKTSKDLPKKVPSTLGGNSSSGLQAKSSKINTLSKSLNFGSRELKQDPTEKHSNSKTIPPNKLLPDKPKLFQRSISTSAACLNTNDGQHRPIICGKDRKKSSSATLSTSFDELPEPQADADLFEQMELLFEEYRKLELGLHKKMKESKEHPDALNDSQQDPSQQQDRGRKQNREQLPTSTISSAMSKLSPTPSQGNNKVTSKPNSTPQKARERPSSAPARRLPTKDATKNLTTTSSTRGRVSPSPNRMSLKNPTSTPTNRVTGQSIQQKSSSSPTELQKGNGLASPRSRPSSAKISSTSSSRGTSPISSNRQTLTATSNKAPTTNRSRPGTPTFGNTNPSTFAKISPAASSQSLSSCTSSQSNQDSASSRHNDRSVSKRRTSVSTKNSPKEISLRETPKSSVAVSNRGSSASDAVTTSKYSASEDKVKDSDKVKDTDTSILSGHSEVSLKMKTNNRSNLRRSSECLTSQQVKPEPLESSVDPVSIVPPQEVPGRTSRPASPSLKTLSKSPIANGKHNKTLGMQAEIQAGSKINNQSSRPGTPTFGNANSSNAGSVKTDIHVFENIASKNLPPKQLKSTPGSIKIIDSAKSDQNSLRRPSGASVKKSSSGIPTSPRGRTPERTPNKLNITSSTRRSASLQRAPSPAGSTRNSPASPTLHLQTGAWSSKSRSSVCVNKAGAEKPKAQRKSFSGSQPELPNSGEGRSKFTRMDAFQVHSPDRSQDDLTDNPAQLSQNRRCRSSQEVFQPNNKLPVEDKEAQTTGFNTDDVLVFSHEEYVAPTTPRRDGKAGRRSRIPQPVGLSNKYDYGRQLNRCDSGVEINSMSPTESNANHDDDSEDEYY